MYLGIDYGLKNIGLALSQGEIASPFKVLRIKNSSQAIQKIQKICQTKKISYLCRRNPHHPRSPAKGDPSQNSSWEKKNPLPRFCRCPYPPKTSR
jgi:RNase H-fold protein (predicted Holliday junction resolvase)